MTAADFTAHGLSEPGLPAAPAGPLHASAPSRRAQRAWPWLVGGLLLLMLLMLLVALAGTAAVLTVGREAMEGAVIHINGQRWEASALDVDALGWGMFGITAALALAALVVTVLVPLSVLLGLAAAALGLGLALLAVLSVAALLLSPLWLVLLLVWALLRRPRPASGPAAAA